MDTYLFQYNYTKHVLVDALTPTIDTHCRNVNIIQINTIRINLQSTSDKDVS